MNSVEMLLPHKAQLARTRAGPFKDNGLSPEARSQPESGLASPRHPLGQGVRQLSVLGRDGCQSMYDTVSFLMFVRRTMLN